MWHWASKHCCDQLPNIAISEPLEMNHSALSLSFCYGSAELISHNAINKLIDSIRNKIQTGWSIDIVTYIDSNEYLSNQDLGIQRAESLLRFFKSVDSNAVISYEIEVNDSLYIDKDSCSNFFSLNFIAIGSVQGIDTLITLLHIDGEIDVVLDESSMEILDKVLKRMKQRKESIQIISFQTTSKKNKESFMLARNRAKAIKNYLIESGAESKMIQLEYQEYTKFIKDNPNSKLQLNQSLIKFLK